MEAIETLEDSYQRTALLLLRWSGARRGEITRLTLDCPDAYPDGYPRLRIPVGKTYTERSIPLHPQAADALRELIEQAKAANAAARHDRWAGQRVRWVFVHRGQPMGKHHLFEDSLALACQKAGLVDGKPTVTAHRFRHTVGTQLAEGGARIQTIMAILGHRNAQISVRYSHISPGAQGAVRARHRQRRPRRRPRSRGAAEQRARPGHRRLAEEQFLQD